MNCHEEVSFGETVRRLRLDQGLSQQELGERVGYGTSGAGISILRIEKQGVIPRQERIDALAKVLNEDPATLKMVAKQARKENEADPLDARIRSLKNEQIRRAALEKGLRELSVAQNNAETMFLLPLQEASQHIRDIPIQEEHIPISEVTHDLDQTPEAVLRLELIRAGLNLALTDHTTPELGSQSFVHAMLSGLGKSALPVTMTSVAAMNSLSAVLRIGQPAARRLVGAGGLIGLTAAMGLGAIVTAFVGRSRRQRADLLRTLENAEADIEHSEPNIRALEALLPQATRLFEDISVFGGRALDRWVAQVGTSNVAWHDLTDGQQERFLSLVDVAAANLMASTISFQDIAVLSGDALATTHDTAEQVLQEANRVVSDQV